LKSLQPLPAEVLHPTEPTPASFVTLTDPEEELGERDPTWPSP
jgi:hypothetical protein